MTLDLLEAQIEIACKELRLPGLRQQFRTLAREAVDKEMDYTYFLRTCLEQEIQERHQKRQQVLLRRAKFPSPKTLADFNFVKTPGLPKMKILKLAEGSFINRHENIICIGKPGAGKSHIAIALGMAAIQAGYRVRFISVMQLVQELQLAEAEYRLPRYLKNWNKINLVILDELGYVPLGDNGKLLFHFISQRYEQGSLIITSNLEFSRWVEVLQDPALTSALLDRLTHHSHILLFEEGSYRLRERIARHESEVLD
jgi:DNA replication protein DnaC